MTSDERAKWIRQFSKGLRSGQLISDAPPDNSLGQVLIAFSVFPQKYASFGTYWICDDGIVFEGLCGRIVLPYSDIVSVDVEYDSTPPKVVLWGMRYWMIDHVSFTLKDGATVQLPLVLLDDGMRRTGMFWTLFKIVRNTSSTCKEPKIDAATRNLKDSE